MPRSGWLAVGAVTSAWTATTLSLSWAAGLASLGVAVVVVAWALDADHVDRRGRMVLMGAGLILARLMVSGVGGGSAVGVPDGRGPWTFVVEATGAARGGNQTATLRSPPAGTTGRSGRRDAPRLPHGRDRRRRHTRGADPAAT